ncbi:hypothetical protein ABH935_007124 [Catenulispora sp. GAS73]|uniref:hypothetical protein n=1 Tax=Catenulispora sp. GAS73 TaxID=3156269 RepID=UPI003516D221
MTDEDADFVWAFDAEDKEALYERASLTDGWQRVAERLPEFMLHHCLMKISDYPRLYSARANVDADDLPTVVDSLDEVTFAGWSIYPVERIFLSDEVLVRAVPAQDRAWPPVELPGFMHVKVSARNSDTLLYLDGIPARDRWYKHSPARLPESLR